MNAPPAYLVPSGISVDIKAKIDAVLATENAGGQFYVAFPYTSAIGNTTQQLIVQVPIKHEQPSDADKKALFEAVSVQGGLGMWIEKDDGTVWLVPSDPA